MPTVRRVVSDVRLEGVGLPGGQAACGRCAGELVRSRLRGYERVVTLFTKARPYRCLDCRARAALAVMTTFVRSAARRPLTVNGRGRKAPQAAEEYPRLTLLRALRASR